MRLKLLLGATRFHAITVSYLHVPTESFALLNTARRSYDHETGFPSVRARAGRVHHERTSYQYVPGFCRSSVIFVPR